MLEQYSEQQIFLNRPKNIVIKYAGTSSF